MMDAGKFDKLQDDEIIAEREGLEKVIGELRKNKGEFYKILLKRKNS